MYIRFAASQYSPVHNAKNVNLGIRWARKEKKVKLCGLDGSPSFPTLLNPFFLGVVLDEHLTWKPDISQVARKISKSIGVINRARFFLPKPCLRTLYYCLVYPIFIIVSLSGDLRTRPIFAVLSLCKSELSELFLHHLSILIQTLFSKN